MILRRKHAITPITRQKLFEMAFDKKEYMSFVYGLADQIAQNWCLCQYCHLYAKNWIDYAHWKSELETHLDNLNRKRISGDKLKWTKEALIKKLEFNDPESVFLACRLKFIKEKDLNIPMNLRKSICNDFADKINDIAECIASKECIVDYTDRWFPEV